MRYRTADALRDALEQRLRTEARTTGVALMRLRKRTAFERFLARLVEAAPRRWVLKGAFALDVRLGVRTRATKDLDLGRDDDESAATTDLAAAAALDLADFFAFRMRRAGGLDRVKDLSVVRYAITTDLAGRGFERFPVDVAFGDAFAFESESIQAPGMLSFAGIDPPLLPVVALEQHVAEKLHAYTGTYGPAERASTRSKDLVDLALIAGLASPDAERLAGALRRTFQSRGRQPLPTTFPAPPREWVTAYARQAGEVRAPTNLDAGRAAVAALLGPVLVGSVTKGAWDPVAQGWSALGD